MRSSFDTTINVLDGLLEFERATGGSAAVREARRGGEEYLLERGLFRRKSTGEVVDPAYLDFAFPYYWHYDVLRALDYFRRAGAEPDPRMAEAVEVVRSKRQPDGRWLLDRVHPGRVHFALEGGVGEPSRWNTLRALRVGHDSLAVSSRGKTVSRSRMSIAAATGIATSAPTRPITAPPMSTATMVAVAGTDDRVPDDPRHDQVVLQQPVGDVERGGGDRDRQRHRQRHERHDHAGDR